MRDDSRLNSWAEVEQYLAAFEAAWAQGSDPDLTDFLPERSHRLYLTVLRELVCVEMEMALGHGQPRSVADYCDRFPELFADPLSRAALTEQERRLRAEIQTQPSAPLQRSGWREQAAVLFENYRTGGVPPTAVMGLPCSAGLLDEVWREDPETARWLSRPSAYPEVGSEFLGFRLVRELGRGTFGRVFLAEQKGLANRLVALKVGERLFGESQKLAQLQHSNIMPIHSAHRIGALQAICMPFLGSTTLQDVLELMRRQGGVPARGNAVWSTLHERASSTRCPGEDPPVQFPPPPLSPPSAAPLERLRDLSQVRAVLWLGVQLAEGLAHAHERGVLHRDLKPANVLIADDGTPLLLDFNLAAEASLPGQETAILGGTLPYMAPEHLGMFLGGPGPVDARSDIYSLGLILFELVTARLPFPCPTGPLSEQAKLLLSDRQAGPPPASRFNPPVTPAIESILARCLHPKPEQRYARALHLAEDLQRQLDDLPLRHTPEPSLRERATKFIRRHPRLVWRGAATLFAILLVATWFASWQRSRHFEHIDALNVLQAFHKDRRDARVLLSLPFPDPTELVEGTSLCRQALAHYGLPEDPDWQNRSQVRALSRPERQALREEIGELLLLLARATWLDATRQNLSHRSTQLERALTLNEQASSLAGSQERRALLLQRAWLFRLTGQETQAEQSLQQAKRTPPMTARDLYLLAGERCSQGEMREALKLLEEATRREPSNAAAWAARGSCLASLKRHAEAIGCFTPCIALLPDFWRGYLWRGRSYLELGEFVLAESDFEEVLTARPQFTPALIFRALARRGRKDYSGAETDLTTALQKGDGTELTRLYFLRASVRQLAGNPQGAQEDLQAGLRRSPRDELSFVTRGYAQMTTDPKAALADFDQALALNPISLEALQNKAHVLSELGRTVEAIETLDRLVTRYPDFVEARIGRGVLHARLGQRKRALEDASESLLRDSRGLILYQAGCIYALTSRQEPNDRQEAYRLVERALRAGFGAEHLRTDPDLSPLRDHQEYQRLVRLIETLAGK